jgi:hypothetical protein
VIYLLLYFFMTNGFYFKKRVVVFVKIEALKVEIEGIAI